MPIVCPVCGTRVGSATTRCLVCRADLRKPGPDPARPRRNTLFTIAPTLAPVVLVLLFLGVGCLFIFGALGLVPLPQLPTPEPSETPTPTETLIPTATRTPAPTLPPTPLPPIEYIIQPGDTILAIAIDHGVAPWDINTLNDLAPDAVLSVGQKILIPIATATPRPVTATPIPTDTPTP